MKRKTIKEQNQESIRRRELKKAFPTVFGLTDSDKCKKGHSYRKETVDIKKGEMLLKPKWVCVKCGREL